MFPINRIAFPTVSSVELQQGAPGGTGLAQPGGAPFQPVCVSQGRGPLGPMCSVNIIPSPPWVEPLRSLAALKWASQCLTQCFPNILNVGKSFQLTHFIFMKYILGKPVIELTLQPIS